MQNDLIVLEFENLDDRAVLLKPDKLADFAEALNHALGLGMPAAVGLEMPHKGLSVSAEVLIAAVEPGSIRIGFRIVTRIYRRVQQEIKEIEPTVNVVDTVISWIIGGGIALGLLTQVAPADQDTVTVEMPEGMDGDMFMDAVERAISAALDAGADKVHIIAPEQPRCLLSRTNLQPELLGSKAQQLPVGQVGQVEGELKILRPRIPFEVEGEIRDMGLAEFSWERKSTPNRHPKQVRTVLVDWDSSQEYDDFLRRIVKVVGEIEQLDRLKYTAKSALTAEDRMASAVLNVHGVQTYN